MKSQRRAPAQQTASQLNGRTVSTHSLKSNNGETNDMGLGAGNEDWLPVCILIFIIFYFISCLYDIYEYAHSPKYC